MKKTLLIATTLMALAIPAHASQINQGSQDNQAKMSQQGEKIEGTTNQACRQRIVNGRKVWYCW
ncbi:MULTISPECIES: hypothetical protein [Calothrix]|uniref:Uncharacterized protein n=2 Tax=Calothrix TaxID=1186 RepID=A0ABR8AI54_9CYAN|nr:MULTISPECIES: hypothetical protein [Calothrix]MBD2199638.1 hypothetical protein [Calothrix parietina FACHB-288]MBD2228455.1 hypothetical protein [Calothrix anomala FACHB-343]